MKRGLKGNFNTNLSVPIGNANLNEKRIESSYGEISEDFCYNSDLNEKRIESCYITVFVHEHERKISMKRGLKGHYEITPIALTTNVDLNEKRIESTSTCM